MKLDNQNAKRSLTIRDYFLSSIEGEHKTARMLIEAIPADRLEVVTPIDGKRIVDLAWYLTIAEHVWLRALCDGQFQPPPEQPNEDSVAAILAWDEDHFPHDLQRLSELSAEDLLRPLDFHGITTKPTWEFLGLYATFMSSLRGQLLACMRACCPLVTEPEVAVAERAASSDETALTDAELANVSGGEMVWVTNPTGYTPVNVYGVAPTPSQPNHLSAFGSLFYGGSFSGAAAAAATGAGVGVGLGASLGVDAVLLTVSMMGFF